MSELLGTFQTPTVIENDQLVPDNIQVTPSSPYHFLHDLTLEKKKRIYIKKRKGEKEPEERKLLRRMKNREAAQISRENKKKYITHLEEQVKRLLQENKSLSNKLIKVEKLNFQYNQENLAYRQFHENLNNLNQNEGFLHQIQKNTNQVEKSEKLNHICSEVTANNSSTITEDNYLVPEIESANEEFNNLLDETYKEQVEMITSKNEDLSDFDSSAESPPYSIVSPNYSSHDNSSPLMLSAELDSDSDFEGFLKSSLEPEKLSESHLLAEVDFNSDFLNIDSQRLSAAQACISLQLEELMFLIWRVMIHLIFLGITNVSLHLKLVENFVTLEVQNRIVLSKFRKSGIFCKKQLTVSHRLYLPP